MFNETREKVKSKLGEAKLRAQKNVRVVVLTAAVLTFMTGLGSAGNDSVNFSKIIDLMEEMPAVIAPIADIIAEMIVIMAYLAVAGLIIGIFAGIVTWINRSFGGFNFK